MTANPDPTTPPEFPAEGYPSEEIPWQAGAWTHPPVASSVTPHGLSVTAHEGADAWRLTSYGFINDSEHALVTPFAPGHAMEVTFTASFPEQFDQAGIFLRASAERWVKAGVEHSDGTLQVGAVVTDGFSDWSVAPVPDWDARSITIRASWSGGALTIRARTEQTPWRLVRVAPLPDDLDVSAGPYACAPSRAGLEVTFSSWRLTAPDARLH
jgi:Uncharacterized conserved protein